MTLRLFKNQNNLQKRIIKPQTLKRDFSSCFTFYPILEYFTITDQMTCSWRLTLRRNSQPYKAASSNKQVEECHGLHLSLNSCSLAEWSCISISCYYKNAATTNSQWYVTILFCSVYGLTGSLANLSQSWLILVGFVYALVVRCWAWIVWDGLS